MGIKHSTKSKNKNNNENEEKFEEQKLFESFQEQKFASEITAITYFKMNSEDIVVNNKKEINNINNEESSLNLTNDKSLNEKKIKRIKHKIYLDKSEIENKLFIFLASIDNIVYIIDSHSFEKILKFREESKTEKRRCKIMFQSEYNKSLLICVHENKLNINKIKIINSYKSRIYCEQLQSIIFGINFEIIYDLKELSNGQLIIGLEGCLFLWNKTNKIGEINMPNLEQRKLFDKILSDIFQQNKENYKIEIKGNNHYIPYKGFYLKDLNVKDLIKKYSVKNILQLNDLLFTILININDSMSVLRFYNIYDKEIILDEKKDLIFKDFKNSYYITKLFYITNKYFGIINIENIIIISSQYKQIVSIYLINDIKLLHNINENNKVSFFIPRCFVIFPDNYFLVQFIDAKNGNIYLKMFKFMLSKNNFVEIFNITKKRIKNDDLIYNILPFKNVKDHRQNNINFAAEFFITNNKNNIIKKWILTNYEKE